MLSFFKKKNKIKKQGNDSTISTETLLNEKDDNTQDEEITTHLSIHPSWQLKEEEKYVYRFLNNECHPLKPNQLSLSGIELTEENDSYRITAFIRSSLSKEVRLKEATLLLISADNEKLGRKMFNLSEIGEIPAQSSRPWHFTFSKEDLFTNDIPKEGWKLAFDLSPSSRKHSLDLAESWQKSLADADKQKLEQMVNKMTPPKPGEVNFLGIQANQKQNGNLHITMLIRNGSPKTLTLKQLPLVIEDATGEIVAKGGFTLGEFEVKANTSKPWTFIFPSSLLLKEAIDLSKWKAYLPSQPK
ncbi:accessory Sec system S-layer assembly protein [Bacillus solimangrovi]|uniref:Accessory Sec system S-layer assembly protein n=1 Tax=Bacillus solimangrovi TaxID=1305675 RepID=A0A1E5LDL2_9BACI|nr:accessory Sec system S-layer assembly protein [Bacillus solimangrovi]OEH92166.1 accessory Sec system S-layer assembly protein [Bacillus solimangrovi]